jgi:glycosyltransferase involved in cell wall biosynthesis
MSNSMMEAMVAGLPIISTNVGAASELVDHKVEGLLIQAENLSELVSAIDRMASHPEEREKMGKSASKKISKYNIENVVLALINAYNTILLPQKLEK